MKKRVERQKLLPFSDDQLSVQRSLISSLRSPIFDLLGSRTGALLQTYFRSGWAFLIPYLAAYLLYAWLRWPVNPASAGSMEQGAESWMPCLLHVYWALHAIHLILGVIALRSWWKGSILKLQLPTSTGAHSAHLLSTVYRLLPWICLGLLFYIPGVYLEFPADPWQHYGRVNEWSWLQTVTEHSAWKKSSYFLAYSLIGQITPTALQLKWFDVYYTSCCLLLCWQYFQLARAVGLGVEASFIFILIQALTLGNNIFGFYRYYGMSSTLFAQLGAVALIRIALEYFSRPRIIRTDTKNSTRSETYALLAIHYPLLRSAATALALLPLIAYNHIQGLGIAGLGIAAVIVWRLIEWRRSVIGWLVLSSLILSAATIFWYPRHPTLNEIYRPHGWLTSWYGFNLFSPASPAFDRTWVIIGAFGLVNLMAALCLFLRNHVAFWLTAIPFLALCSPVVAIPFSSELAQNYEGGGYIITFHRLLLGVPSGLALVVVGSHIFRTPQSDAASAGIRARNPTLLAVAAVALTLALVIPVNGPFYNRSWNFLMKVPGDLRLSHILSGLQRLPATNTRTEFPYMMITRNGGFALNASGRYNMEEFFRYRYVMPFGTPSAETDRLIENIRNVHHDHRFAWLLLPSAMNLETSGSLAGHLSQHWLPQSVAFDHVASRELSRIAQQHGGRQIQVRREVYYIFSDPTAKP